MEILGLHILNGFSYGMILFVIASGLSLVLGVMGILNLAHGSLYLLGAYVGLVIAQQLGNFWVVVGLGGLVAGLAGVLLERFFLRRLRGQLPQQALLTLGVVYIFTNVFLWIFGSYTKMGTPPTWLASSVTLGAFTFPLYRFAVIGFGLGIFFGLWWLENKTRVGAIIRASMDDIQMTEGLGINSYFICSIVFFLGSFLGGVAGMLSTPWLGAGYNFALPILLSALIAVVVGGVGTVKGALLGTTIIGIVDSLSKGYAADFALFAPYIAFVIVILVRPSGILGRKR